MTLLEFSKIYALLAVQLNENGADEPKIRAYFKALQDVEPEFLALAAQRFAAGAALNERGEAWFPKAPEWRALAAKVEQERTAALERILRKRILAGELLCQQCEDTGWFQPTDGTRYRRCPCREQRRLEVLGRRPMPALPAHEPVSDPEAAGKITALAARVKGMA